MENKPDILSEDSRLRFAAELERDRMRWKTRRKMAITALTCNIVLVATFVILGSILPDNQVKNLSEFNTIFITVIGFFSSIVAIYIGAASYSDKNGNNITSK